MRQRLDIIQTLPYLEATDVVLEFVHRCVESNVTSFRFNLAKISNQGEFEKLSEKLDILKSQYPDNKIILDIPYPYKKIRLFHTKRCIHVKEGSVLEFSSNNMKHTKGYINVENLKEYFTLNKKYYYNDGNGEFYVQELSENRIVLCALNEFDLFSSKNIMSDRLVYDDSYVSIYLRLINKYKVNQIWFSFVDDLKLVDKFMKQVDCKCDVFLKIESQAGVNQLRNLLRSNYNIIVARGDLAIDVEWNEFLNIQDIIINRTKEAGKMIYVGTDVLSSMTDRMIPVRAELIDLLLLKRYQIHGIMLNVGLLYGKYYDKAIECIYE